MNIQPIHEIVIQVWNAPGVQLIVAGVLLNVALAVAVALRRGDFSFRVLADFLFQQLAPYVIVYYAFMAFGEASGFSWVSTAVLALIAGAIGARIVEHLSELGVPIPEHVLRFVRYPV